MQWQSYKEKIRHLSQKIVEAQKPIRILNAIKLSSKYEEEFRNSKFKKLPKLPEDYYLRIDLGFDLAAKEEEFRALLKEIQKELGEHNDLGALLVRIVEEYLLVLELLKCRGTRRFYEISRTLYGSPKDPMLSDKNSVFEMARLLYSILTGIKNTLEVPHAEKNLKADEVVGILNERFRSRFGNGMEAVLSDGIVADAAAGGDKIKIRSDRMFSLRDLDIYEVHEGWVHVGTTINGRHQPVAKWLSVGPPRCTATQEGLAVLMEIFTFRTSVRRAQRINDRIISVAKVEEGANLIDIFEYYRTEGYTEEDCLSNSFRVFRGGQFEGGAPFTKDIAYCKGFVENYNFLRAAIRANKPFLIPFLFVGKVHVDDIPLLYRLHKEGIVEAPQLLPQQFTDINGIAVWMSFSSFFNKVDLKQVQAHYNKLFKQHI